MCKYECSGEAYDYTLQAAAAKGDVPVAEPPLRHGAQKNAEGGEYGTPLLAAVMIQHKRLVSLLLKAGADADACIEMKKL